MKCTNNHETEERIGDIEFELSSRVTVKLLGARIFTCKECGSESPAVMAPARMIERAQALLRASDGEHINMEWDCHNRV